MKFLQVGLGSMGKRRIRCLKKLGHESIIGFDPREDRRAEAEKLYGIQTIASLANLGPLGIDALIISTPPDRHRDGIKLALELRKPVFVEAGILLEGTAEARALARKRKVLIAPSCTLRFHPAIKQIKAIVRGGRYGKLTNFSYHCGQYLPDWHPWEKVTDFYVSKKETGGCREIVPFELTWLFDIVGFPKRARGFLGETMDVGAVIDDTYVLAMEFAQQAYGTLIVDVTSRYAIRTLILNMEKGQIQWHWDEGILKLYDARTKKWEIVPLPRGKSAKGYNKNIIEDIYIEEIAAFIAAARGKAKFPNQFEDDIAILKFLHGFENGARRS